MFINCCGRSKKNKETKSTKDAETQSDHEVLAVIENNVTKVASSSPTSNSNSKNCAVITNQPAEIDKRPSVVSDIKIEISDNDDDEVFCEGVGPPIKLAENLAAPRGKGKGFVQLPKWFSEEDDQEVGGVQEPPATPIGKDELALRRHRFFSELLNSAQNANEHKVHFDPFGPVIACNVTDPPSTEEFETLVSRLETVTTRLENVCAPITELLKFTSTCTTPDNNLEEEIEDLTDMTFQFFQDIIDGHLAQYKSLSKYIGGPVEEQSRFVEEAFQVQLNILKTAHAAKQPTQSELSNILQPLSQCIMKVQGIMEAKRGDKQFNHLAAIAESITALGWVAVSPTPAPYVKEMNDAGQFYTNRVLKEWKEKDSKHVEWVRAWIQTLTELQAFVKQHHTTGLVWTGKGGVPVSGAPIPPPPCCPPPPPPTLNDLAITSDASNDRSALFAQLNQGENITRSLKKVTDDMQTHKNPTLRQGPAPFKASSTGLSQVKGSAPVDKAPSFVRDGKKWLIEYQKGNQNLLVDNAEMNNVVYLFKCMESTVTVKGKINSITIDSCKKTSVVFDSLVSCVEFINCQSVQMQVLGKVPTISIDKTDGCQVYLSNDSLDVEIVSSKSSEMNILVPKGNGDYTEYPVPEQYKTTVVPGKGLSTVIIENKG